MTKRELAALQEKFTDHIVLAASEDGKHVCLLSKKDGTPCGYTFTDEADMNGIVPERIKAMRVNAAYVFDKDSTIQVDVAQVTDELSARTMKLNSDLTTANEKVDKLENDLKNMQTRENERRMDAAKKAVTDKLAALNECRSEGMTFDSALADEVIAKINEGCYVHDERDGKWCGDENAVNELMAKCMKAQADMDKNSRKEKHYAWNSLSKKEDTGSIDALLAFANQ